MLRNRESGQYWLVAAVLVLIVSLAALVAATRRRRSRLPGRAVISRRPSTAVGHDGAVRSVQSADLMMAPEDLERLWNVPNLENLARTYWRFLSRVTLGLIRIIYGENERCAVLLWRALTLIRFDAPEYVVEPDHGSVRWRIRDGLLVARAGRGCGYLALDVRLGAPEANGVAKLHIEIEVANFYPAIASRFSVPVYQATQSVVHVLVTRAFLRSLARLNLAKSKVGRLATPAQP